MTIQRLFMYLLCLDVVICFGFLPSCVLAVAPEGGGGGGRAGSRRDEDYYHSKILSGLTVLTTAPPSYSQRLQKHLEDAGANVIPCPTVDTTFLSSKEDSSNLDEAIDNIDCFDYVAFTSRRGIQAFFRQAKKKKNHHRRRRHRLLLDAMTKQKPCAIALGVDVEALVEEGLDRSRILIPKDPTPQGIVDLIDSRLKTTTNNRKDDQQRSQQQQQQQQVVVVLCPVPKVVGLKEPSVIPNFISSLEGIGYGCGYGYAVRARRVNAYETRWMGCTSITKKAIDQLLRRRRQEGKSNIFAIAISSTAEVEGLKRLLLSSQGEGENDDDEEHLLKQLLKGVKVIAHGPVTAKGAQELGLKVDEVSKDSSSFAGMIDAIARCIQKHEENDD